VSNIVADRVKESTTTTGTGDITLAGAAAAHRTFGSVCADGDIVPYCIAGPSEWEVGVGMYVASGTKLTRLEVHGSSNANALVNFSSGSKDVFLTVVSRQLDAIAAFPITSNLYARYSARRSRIDLDTNGYVTKWYDISGNARDSDTAAANKCKYMDRVLNNKYPAVVNTSSNTLKFSALAAQGSPFTCTLVFIVQNMKGFSGNGHLYNWAGNPIGFGPASPLDRMYNGTLPAAHPGGAGVNDADLPPQFLAHPAVVIHAFNGASSIQSINNREVTVSPGTTAGGATNEFRIFQSNTGTDVAKGMIGEFFIVTAFLNSTDRLKIVRWAEAEWGIRSP
jgi:hypothetical protein